MTSQQSSKERVNLYLVLDLMPGASHNEILHAYNRAKNTHSGGSLAGYSLLDSDSASGILEEIEKAFSILGNPSKRREYDLEMGYHTWSDDSSADSKKNKASDNNPLRSVENPNPGLSPVVRSRGSTIFESNSETSNLSFALTAISQESESRGSLKASLSPESNASKIDAMLEKAIESQNEKTEGTSRTIIPMKAPTVSSMPLVNEPAKKVEPTISSSQATPVASVASPDARFEPNREFEDQIKNCTTVDGAFIRAVRVYRGFSVEALAHRTKLGAAHVLAVENEGGDMELPAPVYLRGHVFLICQTLGLPNSQKLATGYIDRLKVQGKIKPKTF